VDRAIALATARAPDRAPAARRRPNRAGALARVRSP
jgi:hypothetical protein